MLSNVMKMFRHLSLVSLRIISTTLFCSRVKIACTAGFNKGLDDNLVSHTIFMTCVYEYFPFLLVSAFCNLLVSLSLWRNQNILFDHTEFMKLHKYCCFSDIYFFCSAFCASAKFVSAKLFTIYFHNTLNNRERDN